MCTFREIWWGTSMTLHRSSSRRTKGGTPLAYATCVISGDGVEPHLWTKYFSIDPDINVEKGKPFRTPSGRLSSQPGRTGVWGYSSKRAIRDPVLDPHIRYLISCLGLPRSDLPHLLDRAGAKLRFLCFWPNYSGDRIEMIDPSLREIIELSGGAVEVDEYPQKHKFVDSNGKETDVLI